MNRRSFFSLTALGISAIGLASVSILSVDFLDNIHYIKPKLLSQLCDDETLRRLGDSYLQLMPAEKHRDRLMQKLYGRVIDVANSSRQELRLMRTQLQRSIRNDFDRRQTIILDGWMLSLTEARQCALFF